MIVDIYKKQTKIGIVSFVGNFLILIANLFLFVFYDLYSCYGFTVLSIFFYTLFSFLFIVSIFKDNALFKYLQVFTYVIISIFLSVVNQSTFDITSIFFLAYACVLFFSYNIKITRKKIIYFSIMLVVILMLNVFLNSIFKGVMDFSSCLIVISDNFAKIIFRTLTTIAFIGSFFGLMWATFWEDIKYLLDKSNKLQIALYRNESDAWYGRNVIGVVHNIKNKLTPLNLLLDDFSRDERLDAETRKFCKNQINSVDGLSGLLDKLLYSTKIKYKEGLENINVNKSIKSIVEFFKSNLEFKKNIKLIVTQKGKDIYFKCNPMNFCFVVENLIKNSYDNLKFLKKEKIINIEIINNINEKYISIKDNGTGIDFIKNEEFKGSLIDCDFFKIGNSTKKDGLGYGMEFIKSFVVNNKINAYVYTKKNFGTEVKIFF